MAEKIRIGIVGGGPGSRIGLTHRISMHMDGQYTLVAGSFSRNPEKSREMGQDLGLDANRVYKNYEDMVESESRRSDGIQVVSVLTQHNTHYIIAKSFLEHGIHVICEKPLTISLSDALDLEQHVTRSGLVFALTHNYSGYPMVRQAAQMIRDGVLGKIKVARVELAQDYGSQAQELHGNTHLKWHTDPAITTKASVLYNLGTHAHHLLRFITGLEVVKVAAEMTTQIPGRRVFDNAFANLRLSNGATGTLWASMVASGNEHGLNIRVFGEKCSLEWHHEDPQHLILKQVDGGTKILFPGCPELCGDAQNASRINRGHPEGLFSSFANLYKEIATQIQAHLEDSTSKTTGLGYPTVQDGVIGVRFVEAMMKSQQQGGEWVDSLSEQSNVE